MYILKYIGVLTYVGTHKSAHSKNTKEQSEKDLQKRPLCLASVHKLSSSSVLSFDYIGLRSSPPFDLCPIRLSVKRVLLYILTSTTPETGRYIFASNPGVSTLPSKPTFAATNICPARRLVLQMSN